MAKQGTTKVVASDQEAVELHEGIGQEVAVPGAAGVPAQYTEDAGGGLDQVGAGETLIPFIRILQALSPQVEQQTIPDARPGMLFNTATQEIFDGKKGLGFVPAFRQHNYAKFTPRDNGGGFLGLVDAHDPYVNECRAIADRLHAEGKRETDSRFGKLPTPDAAELVETFYLYGLFVHPEAEIPIRGVMGFASSAIKPYKGMMTRLMSMVTPVQGRYVPHALWVHRWMVSTISVKGKKGNFYNWQINLVGGSQQAAMMKPDDMLYQVARDFHLEIKKGAVKAAYEQQEKPAEQAEDLDPGM